MSFFNELKRRNVFRIAIAYVVVAWLVAQVLELVFDSFGTPAWVMKTVLVLLATGLPFALFFAWAFELTPEGIKREREVERSQSITAQTGKKLNNLIMVVMALALAYFAYDKFVLSGSRETAAIQSALEQATSRAATEQAEDELTAAEFDKTIAVLPFVNMSSDPEQEYFSDGISEEILNALAKVTELQVTGRTSSFAFKGENQDLRRIGEALGVANILEGSVRKSGNTVRITAQLIRVDNGFHLWSETYDRELQNIFAIQDEIAANILQQLKATLLDEQKPLIAAARTNTEAYDLYLLARQRIYERSGATIEAAADLLDRAIAIDPDYAPAYAQRAIANMLLSDASGSYGDIPQQQADAQAKLYLDKALQLDPNLAEAWAGLGLYYQGKPTVQEQMPGLEALQKALAINPGLVDASNWLHNQYLRMGRPVDALRVMKSLIERDPLYRPAIGNAVSGFIGFGQQRQALAYLDRIRPLLADEASLKSAEAGVRLSLGQLAEARTLIEASVALNSSNSVARGRQSLIWYLLQQYDRVIADGEDWTRVSALTVLERYEEASILAFNLAEEQTDIGTLFAFLNQAGRSDELVGYLEARWPDLATFRADFPPFGTFGDWLMINVAFAYSRAGNQQRFDEAMALIRESHDALVSQGARRNIFLASQAAYFAMAGDHDTSLEYLDRAVTAGLVATARMALEWPALLPLEGDPRYEAIQARMLQHLNKERAKLELEPVSS